MTDKQVELEEALALALRLSPLDKVRLVERMMSTLEAALTEPSGVPFETYEGVLAHLGPGPSDEDIAEVRREMMRNFPREDFEL